MFPLKHHASTIKNVNLQYGLAENTNLFVMFFSVGWDLAGIKHKEISATLKDQLYCSISVYV